jgi:hypothetical protein
VKEYKMRIPKEGVLSKALREACKMFGYEKQDDIIILRKEINQLAQEHAFKLGYYWHGQIKQVNNDYADHLYFHNDGMLGWGCKKPDPHIDEELYFNELPYTEITWQDFLKLTPEDVNGKLNEEEIDEAIKSGHDKNHFGDLHDKIFNGGSKTERDEKAWDIYNSLIASGSLKQKDNVEIKSMVNQFLQIFDEFIKQKEG